MQHGGTWDVKVTYDSSRFFITFKQNGHLAEAIRIPGRNCLPLYIVVKQQHLLKRSFGIQLWQSPHAHSEVVDKAADRFLAQLRITEPSQSGQKVPNVLHLPQQRLPTLADKVIPIYGCYTEDPSNFWCHWAYEKSQEDIKFIESHSKNLKRWDVTLPLPVKGDLVMAPFEDVFYRAKVLSVVPTNDEKGTFKLTIL